MIPALLLEAVNAAPLWMLMLMFGLSMPVAEEVLFRGFLLRGYLGINPSGLRIALAVLWTSAAFAVLQHGHVAPIRMAELGGLGVMLGLVRVWSGSLFLPIAMHIAHNVSVVPLGLWFWV